MEITKVKELIQEKTEIALIHQRLIFQGQLLKDEKKVKDFQLKEGAIVHLLKTSIKSEADNQSSHQHKNFNGLSPQMLSFLYHIRRNPRMQLITSQIFSRPNMREYFLSQNPDLAQDLQSNPQIFDIIQNPVRLERYAYLYFNRALQRLEERYRTNQKITLNVVQSAIQGALNNLQSNSQQITPQIDSDVVSFFEKMFIDFLQDRKSNVTRGRTQHITAEQLRIACERAIRTLNLN